MRILVKAENILKFPQGKGRTKASFPEHTGVVTEENCTGQPDGRGEMVADTKTSSDINWVISLGRLESTTQLLKALLVPKTCQESSTVYIPLKDIKSSNWL